jgi:hypothetical protein
MRKIENLKLPRWIIKKIKHGKEDEDFSAMAVGTIFIYAVSAIAYFAYAPFGREYLNLEVIVAITILALMGIFGFWFVAQVSYLDSLRNEALISFEHSKTKEEREDATLRLETLCVPIPDGIKTA